MKLAAHQGGDITGQMEGMLFSLRGFRGTEGEPYGFSGWDAMGLDSGTLSQFNASQITANDLWNTYVGRGLNREVAINRAAYSTSPQLLPGTNGNYDGTFMGVSTDWKTKGKLVYGVAGQGNGPRPFVNFYSIDAFGGDMRREWVKTFAMDFIGDQASVVWNATGYDTAWGGHNGYNAELFLYMGYCTRWQNTGQPAVSFFGFNGESQLNGGSYSAFSALGSMSEWGQVLDACNLPESKDSQPVGMIMWQRQWWGPMVAFVRRTGFNGNSFTHHNVTYLNMYYQNWIYESDASGNQGSITYSPMSQRAYPIFVYEPQNQWGGGITGGSGMAIVSFTVSGDIAGTGWVGGDNNTRKNDLISFIWGGECKPYRGWNMAPSIQYLGDYYGYDMLAYAWFSEYYGFRIRFVYYDPEGRDECSYPILAEFDMGSDYNVNQRTRISLVSSDHLPNDPNKFFKKVALSWVDSSNITQVATFSIDDNFNIDKPEPEWQSIDAGFEAGARGLLGTGNTYRGDGYNHPAHGIVAQGTNENTMTTYIWSVANHSYSVDKDRTFFLKTF